MGLTGRRAALLCALGVLLAMGAVVPLQSTGATQEEINRARARLAESREREAVLTTDISRINRRIATATKQVRVLKRREAVVQGELNRKQVELDGAEARLKRLRLELKRAQKVLARRLVEIYKADEPDMVTVILESDGFSDMLERVDFMSRIGEADSHLVDRVRSLKERAKREERRVQAAYDVIHAKREQLAQTRSGLQAEQGSLVVAKGERRDALASTKERSQELEEHLAALERANQQVTGQLQNQTVPGTESLPKDNGPLAWPVNGPIVSPFGPRWGRLHAGVDIAAPTGTPIHASANGVVTIAGWVGGYGNYTCVQYSRTNSYCNGHQSAIFVSVGQRVRRGQVIGRVGCTGHCFGPHTHFEVRVNGSPVNPVPYL